MKKIALLIFSILLFSGCELSQKKLPPFTSSPESTDSELVLREQQDLSPTPMAQVQQLDFSARFEIYTNGTKRIFTDQKYHNQSPNVYIESIEPSTIRVKRVGTTWSDFFQTLPMSLTSDCLVTGTKQTFCSNDSFKLRFWLNGVETPAVLNLEMKPDDFLKVEYGP